MADQRLLPDLSVLVFVKHFDLHLQLPTVPQVLINYIESAFHRTLRKNLFQWNADAANVVPRAGRCHID